MTIPELIQQKRDGLEHTRAELETLILGYARGEVADYQVAAWLMAVYWRGMGGRETADLTDVMAGSGDTLDLSGLPNTVDKHSTGGVGDKTTLVLAPMLAALGFTVAKMSGRGLAHTGGTIDKLESLPGWRAELDEAAFLKQAREVGLALVGQSKNLAPADGLLYALRDVTATVDSLPLIASSIMSKKLAAGAGTIILDVKVGAGAFMKTPEEAARLAEVMVEIGRHAGRQVRALLTDMAAPLGHLVGNSLELREAVLTLRGEGPPDLLELCLALAGEALLARGDSERGVDATRRAREVIQNGAALGKLRAFVAAQGGDPSFIDDPDKLDVAPARLELRAQAGGVVARVDALAVGRAVLALGGGRTHKGASIDHGVGVELPLKPGDPVAPGDVLARLYHRERGVDEASELLRGAFELSAERPPPTPLILGRIA